MPPLSKTAVDIQRAARQLGLIPRTGDLIGHKLQTARQVIQARHPQLREVRVIRKDGRPLKTKDDYVPNRINVELENGRISDIHGWW